MEFKTEAHCGGVKIAWEDDNDAKRVVSWSMIPGRKKTSERENHHGSRGSCTVCGFSITPVRSSELQGQLILENWILGFEGRQTIVVQLLLVYLVSDLVYWFLCSAIHVECFVLRHALRFWELCMAHTLSWCAHKGYDKHRHPGINRQRCNRTPLYQTDSADKYWADHEDKQGKPCS